MARNYDLNENDYDTIDNHWGYEAHETYGVDFNGVWYKNKDGVWYKNEDDERN